MKWSSSVVILIVFLFSAESALCSNISAKLGPGTVGFGGSNPVAIPPTNPADWEVTYLTNSLWEINLGVIPGVTVGKRLQFSNIYASAGLGFLASLDGFGGGLYTSVGLDTSVSSKSLVGFVAEYKQSLGFNSYGQIMSYALRFGISVNF